MFTDHSARCDADRLIPPLRFETLPPDLWIVAIINIHAGVNAMKMLRRSVPNAKHKAAPYSEDRKQSPHHGAEDMAESPTLDVEAVKKPITFLF